MKLDSTLFQRVILHWFDQHGRKHLPWQQNKTPYRVWLSEIMLQQTQVATVIPYYQRFITQFPDVLSLANAQEDDVLHLWAGLGYYSRARNLHKAANMVVREFAGQFPDTIQGLTTLPGIGQSTAGAILSIAFNKRAAILDGNVKRVLARLHGIREAITVKNAENALWDLANAYAPDTRCADYTQAMMDLGATLCTRSKPQCLACPLQTYCVAFKENLTHELPKKKVTRALPIRQATFLIIKNKQGVLLEKRPATGIWGGLWCLPQLDGQPDDEVINTFCEQSLHTSILSSQSLPFFRHTFSHYHLDMFPILLMVKDHTHRIMEAGKQIWYNLDQQQTLGLPKPIQTIMRNLLWSEPSIA